MRQVIFVVLLLCLAATAKDQGPSSSTANQPCKLTVAQSPEIRGIRLGMTAAKLQAAFPEENNQAAIEIALKESKQPTKYGAGRAALQPSQSTPNPKFSNVGYIDIDLLDERVSAFSVGYYGPEWKSTEQFIAKLLEAFHLPAAENWSGAAADPNRSLRCEGFVINAFSSGGGNSLVTVGDVSASKIVNDRREAAKEKVRQAFKP